MPIEEDLKKKFFGVPIWIIVVVIVFAAYQYGYLDSFLGENSNETTTSASYVTTSGDLNLDTTLVNVTANGTALASTTYSYNENTNTVTIPLDVSATNDSTDTTFVMAGRSTSGTITELLNFTESGVRSEPDDDQALEFTIYIENSYLGGLTSTQSVAESTIAATVSPEYFTSGSTKHYTVELRSDSRPDIEVDSTDDRKTYSWTTASTTKTVPVTFSIPWTTVDAMDEYSDTFDVQVTVDGGDDSPLTVQFLRNDAIIS